MSVIIITGCSSGIGRAAALAFARRGYRVYATMLDPKQDESLKSLIDEEGLDVEILHLDVTDDVTVRNAVEFALDRDGRLDVVVNNAGVGPFAPLERSTDADWLTTLDINLIGPLRLTRAALPAMREQGNGTIINISSIAGRMAPIPTQGAYAASKHALCALTDSINVEAGQFGVVAHCIEPAFFATSILEHATIAELAENDPYRPLAISIEQLFRDANASAPPPDAVVDVILNLASGTLAETGTHHPIGIDGFAPTSTAARN